MYSYKPKFYEGDYEFLNINQKKLSIVGSRSILDQSKMVLENLFEELKGFDLCIVSGGMYGVDIYAHNLALMQDMKTIFVLPQGIESYKKSSLNRQLRFKPQSSFLYISDYPSIFSPRKYTFLERNKIIAELSEVTLVAQASIKSGSLSTAFSALKKSKKVIAIPVSLHNPQFQGTNYLISKGSIIYLNPETVLDSIGLEKSSIDSQIIETLRYQPFSLQELSNKLEVSVVLVQRNLLKLILEGAISFDGVKYYI
jgi:DNA processing protein